VRRANIIRPVSLHTTIPEDVWTKVSLHLYSEIEGRVPKGAYQNLIVQLLRDYLNNLETPNV
jgi:hypothetical protein